MKSLWNDKEAAETVERYAAKWGEDLAMRVYTSRLVGRDSALVLHGGGNTSLKGKWKTILGDVVDAIFVKGSGADLDAIEPAGLPAVDLAHLERLRTLDALADEQMVNELRTHLFDASAPNPSVETLLHAFLPHKFVDHTHADVALVLTNQASGAEDLVREAFGAKWAIVPYVMPGFALAKLAAEVYERDRSVEGLVLLGHGLFSFADDARTSYERMIAAVDRAETYVAARAKPRATSAGRDDAARARAAARMAPALRGALAEASGEPDRPFRRFVLDWRASEQTLAVLASPDVAELADAGPLTPDHVIRTKPRSLLVPPSVPLDDAQALRAEVRRFREAYDAYFAANRERASGRLVKLDSAPRVVLVPGVGVFGVARTKRDARIAADIADHTLWAKALANDLGRYASLPDGDLFDVEYWSLEQAKLGRGPEPTLAGQVALVTGGAGAIGFEVARKLVAAGAHVVVADVERERVDAAVSELDPKTRGVAAGVVVDVTDEDSVAAAFDETCRAFGGVDVVVPSAGISHVGSIEEMDPDAFWQVVEVNLMGTFLVLREAAKILRRQGTGGNVVVVSSKNVAAPGKDFGAYSSAKAGAHQLAKVAAIELADAGVRVNLVAVDAVFGTATRRSGLWETVGPARAKSRGIPAESLEDFYRQRNLLQVRVTGAHVGAAVVFFASNQTPTTGASLPIDGGLPEAFPR